MGVNPSRGRGNGFRPLLQSDIERAQAATRSGHEAARYLHVDYSTYKKYAKMYGLFERHINRTGKGIPRKKMKGLYGLDEILAGKYPHYDKGKLKERLIKAGYLPEECGLCGFNQKRVVDNRCPLVLHTVDGNGENLTLDNLQLRCYNCTYLTTGTVGEQPKLNPGVYEDDLMQTGELTQDDIEAIQNEFMGED